MLSKPAVLYKVFLNRQVLCLLAFLCSTSPGGYYTGYGWVHFATISGFINAVIWFVLQILNVVPRIIANQYIVSNK